MHLLQYSCCTIRADSWSVQRHPQQLASGSKRFCSGANFVLEPSRFRSPTTPLKLKTPATLTNTMDIEGTYEGGPQESGNNDRVPCWSWCPHNSNSVKVEQLSFCFQTIQQTPRKFSLKVSRNLIFAVRDESAKTAKIMGLENLALYVIHTTKLSTCT